MINLSIPSSSGSIYVEINDVLFGPLGQTSLALTDVPLTLDYDGLIQGPGIFKEKAVDHWKSEGNVTYCQPITSSNFSPTSTYPGRYIVDLYYSTVPGAKLTKTLSYGFLAGGGYGYSTSLGNFTHKTVMSVENGFRLYTVSAPKSSPGRVSVSYVEVKDVTLIEDKKRVSYQSRTVTLNDSEPTTGIIVPNGSWLAPRDAAAIMALVNQAFPVSLGNFTASSDYAYCLQREGTVSPSTMKVQIAAWIATNMSWTKDPNELVSYGDLAAKASEGFNANQVNMIAFLRDLRRPKELIPKLHEMWRLKNVANNYLTFKYGILPTIEDLNSIVTALKGIKPYLDQNGYQTVTASHSASSVVRGVTYDLEQHIKVAVDNEDDGLISIINRIDSMGFLTTFENTWDLIPFSFVIDWFLDIGSLLSRLDGYLRLLRYNVRYATMSHKRTASAVLTPTTSFPFAGNVDLVQYHRWVTDHCPEPTLSLPEIPPDFDHWIESGALIIQRKSK